MSWFTPASQPRQKPFGPFSLNGPPLDDEERENLLGRRARHKSVRPEHDYDGPDTDDVVGGPRWRGFLLCGLTLTLLLALQFLAFKIGERLGRREVLEAEPAFYSPASDAKDAAAAVAAHDQNFLREAAVEKARLAAKGAPPPPGLVAGSAAAAKLDMMAVRRAAAGLLGTLRDYYGKDFDVLAESFFLRPTAVEQHLANPGGGNATALDAATARRAAGTEAGQHFIAAKMARALVWGDAFVVSTIGSSVAAGHDNCGYDSYENQLARTLGPVFSAAGNGARLVVRNAGEGGSCGDGPWNQHYCVRQAMGDDTDVGHYSWTYFEPASDDSYQDVHEEFIRWLLLLPHSPAALLINTGGDRAPGGGAKCAETTYGPGAVKLGDMYGRYGFNVLCLQSGLIAHGYTGKKWGEVGDGLHHTTRYGHGGASSNASSPKTAASPPFTASNPSAAFLAKDRTESLGVVFRNWHPGPLGFQIVSDALAWSYASALLLALDDLDALHAGSVKDSSSWTASLLNTFSAAAAAKDGGRDQAAFAAAATQRYPRKPALLDTAAKGADAPPAPAFCKPELCGYDAVNWLEAPGCLNTERPTYGRAQVHWVNMAEEDSFNPFRAKGFRLVESKKSEQVLYEYRDGARRPWTKVAGSLSTLTPRDEQNFPECDHLDACDALVVNAGKGGKPPELLVFRLPRMRLGRILLCAVGQPDAKKGGESILKAKPRFFIGKDELDLAAVHVADPRGAKCVQVQESWGAMRGATDDHTGHLYLGILFDQSASAVSPPKITHVIVV